MCKRSRGQVVLLAAAVVALALVPIVGAYLQLGFAGDQDALAARVHGVQEERSVAVLRGALRNATPVGDRWTERNATVASVRNRLAPSIDALESTWAATDVRIDYNQTAATRLVNVSCPAGPDRDFGECAAIEGTLVQNRSGTTHVDAIVVDIIVIDANGYRRSTHVIRSLYRT